MTKCYNCKKIIGPSSVSFKYVRGFLNEDGSFFEDATIIVHAECSQNINGPEELERIVKES